jgi:FkbM family methyltransferase
MSFISYAQNYEDVILYRVFKDVKNGTYIDVGANDPEVDSVTKLFYDQGWSGINIEPVESWFNRLCQERPNDINLQAAIGDHEGKTDFYEVVGTGLSTMDKRTAHRHAREHGYEVKSYEVLITRLSTVLNDHPLPEIHFLKIDVEGAEGQVLQGLDLQKTRPWICIVESTLPNRQEESYESWEEVLLAADYEFTYFDGLNRFYVAKEHQELKKLISNPPNVFDDFNLSGKSNSPLHYQLSKIQASLAAAHEQNNVLDTKMQEAEARHASLQDQIEKALNNTIMQDELLRDKEQRLQEAVSDLDTGKQLLRDKALELQEVKSGREKAEKLLKDREGELREATLELAESQQKVRDQEKIIDATSGILAKSLKQFRDLRDRATFVEESLIRRDKRLHESQAKLNEQQQRIQQLEVVRESDAGQMDALLGELGRMQRELDRVRGELDLVQAANQQWQLKAENSARELQAIRESKSWRITLPLRVLWKPIDKYRTVVAPEPAKTHSETAKEESVHIATEPTPNRPVGAGGLGVDEILSRIRKEF